MELFRAAVPIGIVVVISGAAGTALAQRLQRCGGCGFDYYPSIGHSCQVSRPPVVGQSLGQGSLPWHNADWSGYKVVGAGGDLTRQHEALRETQRRNDGASNQWHQRQLSDMKAFNGSMGRTMQSIGDAFNTPRSPAGQHNAATPGLGAAPAPRPAGWTEMNMGSREKYEFQPGSVQEGFGRYNTLAPQHLDPNADGSRQRIGAQREEEMRNREVWQEAQRVEAQRREAERAEYERAQAVLEQRREAQRREAARLEAIAAQEKFNADRDQQAARLRALIDDQTSPTTTSQAQPSLLSQLSGASDTVETAQDLLGKLVEPPSKLETAGVGVSSAMDSARSWLAEKVRRRAVTPGNASETGQVLGMDAAMSHIKAVVAKTRSDVKDAAAKKANVIDWVKSASEKLASPEPLPKDPAKFPK